LEYIVLGLLMTQDMTIYQLNQAFNSGLSLIYSASYGSIQNAIKKLLAGEDIGFIETVENGRNKKIYHLTEKGKISFFQWMHAELPMNKLEMIVLSKVFFLGLIVSAEEKKQILQKILIAIKGMESELIDLAKTLSQLELPEDAMKIYRFQFKTLDYGILSHGVAREWVQKIMDEL
jgi:PadR family transcriptional regulator, regulatory protein AphA